MSEHLFEQKNVDKVPDASNWRPPEPPRSKSSKMCRYSDVIKKLCFFRLSGIEKNWLDHFPSLQPKKSPSF